MRCLLVVPAFHESARLPAYLHELLPALDRSGFDCEVLIVDDGSSSEEAAYIRDIAETFRPAHPRLREPLCLDANLGKGGAVRAGWALAEDCDWVGFVDADGAIPVREVIRLLRQAQISHPPAVIFGSRVKMLGRRVERSTLRHWSGRFFAFLVSVTISPRVYDSQCGFKLLPAAALRRIGPWLREDGFSFDVEILAALEVAGIPIQEVPIDWTDTPGTKVRLFRDTWRMARALLRISHRRRSWTSLKAPTSWPTRPWTIGTIEPSSNSSLPASAPLARSRRGAA
jgi:glycosyltransferase involved in cell wall biosynthesis